ncbi:MAG: SDR family oxidoreductase [Myxococcaceae bacterium]
MKDKVIVITGGSSGIGEALALECARQGAKVVLTARREAELNQVAKRCGEGASVVIADVTKRAEVQRVFDAARQRHGHVDVWVNNAGRGISKPVSQLDDADVDEMVAVNVKSALYGMQAVLPHFQERKAGHIINISSGLGRVPLAPVRSAYSGAKAFLNQLTASLRMELGVSDPGITVSTVSPGVVATDFGNNALHGGFDSRKFPNAQPVDEVAKVIAGLIDEPKADIYTTPFMQKQVAAYFAADDMGAIEAQLMQRR